MHICNRGIIVHIIEIIVCHYILEVYFGQILFPYDHKCYTNTLSNIVTVTLAHIFNNLFIEI